MKTITYTMQERNTPKSILDRDAILAYANTVPARNRKGVICLNAFTN